MHTHASFSIMYTLLVNSDKKQEIKSVINKDSIAKFAELI